MDSGRLILWIRSHKGRIIGVFAGVIIAVLFLTIGVLRTLLILFLGAMGYLIGMFFDSKDEFRNLLGKIIPKGKDE